MSTRARSLYPFGLLGALVAMSLSMSACTGDPKAEETGPPVTIAPEDMIDDFEDGDDVILERGSRTGYWYTYKDLTGGMLTPDEGAPVMPEMGGANGSFRAVRYFGGGFKEWGAGLGFQFSKVMNDPPGKYNLSAYTGMAFWAKGNVPIRVTFGLPEVLPGSEGGTCVDNATMTNCHDVHGMIVQLTKDWRQIKVPFDRLRQEGFGLKATWDPTKVISSGFDVGPVNSFEVFIDDVGFYK
jgi:hypothetical protein